MPELSPSHPSPTSSAQSLSSKPCSSNPPVPTPFHFAFLCPLVWTFQSGDDASPRITIRNSANSWSSVGRSGTWNLLSPSPPARITDLPSLNLSSLTHSLKRSVLWGLHAARLKSTPCSFHSLCPHFRSPVADPGNRAYVVDLSFPPFLSVNSGTPKDTYLDAPFSLRLPGTDALQAIIRDKGPGCHLFKRDLSRRLQTASRRSPRLQLPWFPPQQLSLLRHRAPLRPPLRRDDVPTHHLCGHLHVSALSASTAPTTSMISGAQKFPPNPPPLSTPSAPCCPTLASQSSPDKDSPPATSMVFLGVLFDTLDMSMRVTPDRLSDLLSQCQATLLQQTITIANLRSLLGVMSFVTACVRPARIFMNGLLNALRSSYTSRLCHISDDLKSDLHWWGTFLSQYNGVSIIKIDPWITDPLFLSTDACLTGAGGFFEGFFFHTPFPDFVLSSFGHDINTLELLAIMAALKLWGDRLRGKRFLLHCDNANSVLALNSGRSRASGHAGLSSGDLVFVRSLRFWIPCRAHSRSRQHHRRSPQPLACRPFSRGPVPFLDRWHRYFSSALPTGAF